MYATARFDFKSFVCGFLTAVASTRFPNSLFKQLPRGKEGLTRRDPLEHSSDFSAVHFTAEHWKIDSAIKAKSRKQTKRPSFQ